MVAYAEKLTCKKVQVDIAEGEGDIKTVWLCPSLTSYNFPENEPKTKTTVVRIKWIRFDKKFSSFLIKLMGYELS